MPKLTKSFVKSISFPERGQIIIRDDQLPGFGLRVTPGSKTYIVEARVKCPSAEPRGSGKTVKLISLEYHRRSV